MQNKPIVIVGGGLAGYYTAREFRRHDKITPLVLLCAEDGRYYYKPNLSTAFRDGLDVDKLVLASADEVATQLGIEYRPGEKVLSINTEQQFLQLETDRLSYARLVLATGAVNRQLKIDGLPDELRYDLNQLSGYQRFRQQLQQGESLVVLGAGIIGCEYASDFAAAGFTVQVVAPCQRVMDVQVPPAISKVVAAALQRAGVCFHFNTQVVSAQKAAAGYVLRLANGKEITADKVVLAAGLLPQVSLAKQAGLLVEKGIVVNDKLETSDPAIYAIGDCAQICGEVSMYVTPILTAAKALGKTLAGVPTSRKSLTTPVLVKTVDCALVFQMPAPECQGRWQYWGEGSDIEAQFIDLKGKLQGFALTGKAIVRKTELAAEVSKLAEVL